jgi:gamma-glutamyl hercynylcysteine S-oxide hydrolase
MCRHLAYLGPPIRLGELLADPPHSLVVQSWAPRRQTHGLMNVDGFGVGWYVDGDEVPGRHRGAGPVWSDQTFADLGRVIRAGSFLAAVRSATAAMPPGTAAAAPFRSGPWLFSHNGALGGWPHDAAELALSLPARRLLTLDASSDAALLWALTLDRLERGEPMGAALAAVVAAAAKACGGRINLLMTDGTSIAATALGASLCWRRLPTGGLVVASEPYDDDPGWRDVPENSLVLAGAAAPDGDLSITHLEAVL